MLLDAFDLAKHCVAIDSIILLRHGDESYDTTIRRDAEDIGHEILNQCCIALVECWVEVGGDSCDGQDVAGIESAGQGKTGAVIDVDHDGGVRFRVSDGEVVGKVCDKCVFILDLRGLVFA